MKSIYVMICLPRKSKIHSGDSVMHRKGGDEQVQSAGENIKVHVEFWPGKYRKYVKK
jgi:hypothetical protein